MSDTRSLEPLRSAIDQVDQQMVRLLNQRTLKTADAAQRNARASAGRMANHEFESKIIQSILEKNEGPIPDSALIGIYRHIVRGALRLARPLRVGYLGPYGTFSHQAATQYFGDGVDYENLRALEGVFEEVSRGHVDFGLVPIENSTGGAIIETLDAFSQHWHHLTIAGEIRLPIRFCLMGKCHPHQVKTIYSKAEALAQCHPWLVEHYPDAQRIPYASTAAAVELAYLADPADGVAAIGSHQAAQLYDLPTLAQTIETQSDNITRFLILSQTPSKITGNDKTSLMFTCSDQPGSLVDILKVFQRHAINLSHIEKRPSREPGSDYTFFVDMTGHASEGKTAEILGEARAYCKSLNILGSYPVYDPDFRYQAPPIIIPAESTEALTRETEQIDSELVRLVNERAQLVVQVGEFKRQSDVPIYAPHRESAVLTKIRNLNDGPLRNETLESIYRELMSGSFRLEKPLAIGFEGPDGEFSHLAAVRQFGSSVDFKASREIRTVFQQVVDGEIDYGIVPIENSSVGGINATLDAFLDFHQQLNIYGEVKLQIRYCLLADCKPEQVKTIYSKPEVFAQCRNWLSTQYPNAEQVPTESTAIAAVTAKEAESSHAGAAAIGSSLAGSIHGLRILFEGIEDRQGNMTRFLILSTRKTQISGNDKTSLMFQTVDRPGALVEVLDVFKKNSINLTHLEKRPGKEVNWDYTFFIDLEGHRDDPRTAQVIGEARAHCKSLTILGSFPLRNQIL